MDVRVAGEDVGTLRRIIALLVALAVLAERAGSSSAPVRCLVLWLLRRAESVAAVFVFEATGVPRAFGKIAVAGSGPADALRLAARLKALAAALRTLLAVAWRHGLRRGRRGTSFAPVPPSAVRLVGGRMHGPNDTS